ncbi:MAG: hypothetical protein SXA11_02350 [Cyanobacteriota bacterium]|nr:hypothetical protein [Cyanobacteriota bacterium]
MTKVGLGKLRAIAFLWIEERSSVRSNDFSRIYLVVGIRCVRLATDECRG